MTSTETISCELVGCPERGDPAEVLDRCAMESTGGPIEHVQVRCINRHWFRADRRPTPAGAPAVRRDLTHRDGAILRAVEEGTAELLCGAGPDLFVGGRCCTDQAAARRLVRAGLIAAWMPGAVGTRVPARLTPAGRTELVARSWLY